MRNRLVASVVIALFSLGSACGDDTTETAQEAGVRGPKTFTISVDAPSPEGQNFQFASFFPSSLKVRPGDTITFDNRSTQAPHTVSFGVDPDLSNAPPQGLPTGGPNPAVQGVCYTERPPSKNLTSCANEPGAPAPAYGGKGYWNSGFLVPAVAPEGPKNIQMELAADIAPGKYIYLCLLHRPMVATIEVVAEDEQRVAPADVHDQAETEIARAEEVAATIPEPKTSQSRGTLKAVAGTGEGAIAVNKFYPEEIEVEAGTKVAWYAHSMFEPHTITFGSKWGSGADDPAAFAPAGAASGSRYSGGLANSGFIPPPGSKSKVIFELTFTKPGTYRYVCVLHPGMEGVVRVR